MDAYPQIESRYGIAVPKLYRTLHDAGHFDPESPNTYIAFTDHQWLSLEQIATYELADWQTITKQWFTPFSHSARCDEWGWRRDWSQNGEPAVVFCQRGPEGHGYAPAFRGFLYRMLLEELSGTWLLESHDDANGKQQLLKSIEYICPHLPSAWAARITELSRQQWYTTEDGTIGVYPRSECELIVAEDLAFGHLNEEFLQELEDEA